MKTEVLAPGAQLFESMRAIGYSLSTALADIVDNSITASASNIAIHFSVEGDPYVAIVDDGKGMDGATARAAMQLAGVSAQGIRAKDDLGRFGLGLKTASLSQCRRLTIVSKRDGEVTALTWDLDVIAASGEWSLIVHEPNDVHSLPHVEALGSVGSGTVVIWQNLDRALEVGPRRSQSFDERMALAREHLSLVFHRFISGETSRRRVGISINFVDIPSADPFLAKNPKTQVSAVEQIVVDDSRIEVQAFTLPFINAMSASDRKRAQIAGTFRDSQGFYVYRAGRLVIWGTWFRLMPKTDLGKLARVKVDIPNTLDHLWSLDIKKSSAVPPAMVRERLRRLAGSMITPSEKVHRYRGRKAPMDDSLIRTWEMIEDRGGFRYAINRAHPILASLVEELDQAGLSALEGAFRVIETTFPSQDLFNRMSGDQVSEQEDQDPSMLRGALLGLWRQHYTLGESCSAFVARMALIEPFNQIGDRDETAHWIDSQISQEGTLLK